MADLCEQADDDDKAQLGRLRASHKMLPESPEEWFKALSRSARLVVERATVPEEKEGSAAFSEAYRKQSDWVPAHNFLWMRPMFKMTTDKKNPEAELSMVSFQLPFTLALDLHDALRSAAADVGAAKDEESYVDPFGTYERFSIDLSPFMQVEEDRTFRAWCQEVENAAADEDRWARTAEKAPLGQITRDWEQIRTAGRAALKKQEVTCKVKLALSELFRLTGGESAIAEAIKQPLPHGMDPPSWWKLGTKDELQVSPVLTDHQAAELADKELARATLSKYRKRVALELLYTRMTNTRTMGLFLSLAASLDSECPRHPEHFVELLVKHAVGKKRPALTDPTDPDERSTRQKPSASSSKDDPKEKGNDHGDGGTSPTTSPRGSKKVTLNAAPVARKVTIEDAEGEHNPWAGMTNDEGVTAPPGTKWVAKPQYGQWHKKRSRWD